MSWECGIDVGLDEQTIGFKGKHEDKICISYKAEGDGFMCDALCDNGFTHSVFFRNEVPSAEIAQQGLSLLHARSIWLFNQLTLPCHRAWVDNLYMTAKFAKAGFASRNRALLSGVSRVFPSLAIPTVLCKSQRDGGNYERNSQGSCTEG